MDIDISLVGLTRDKMQKVSTFRVTVNMILAQKSQQAMSVTQAVKYLYAAKFDVTKAEEIFHNYEKYHEEYNLSYLHTHKQLLNPEIRSKKLEILGARDNDGAQILLFTVNRHNKSCDHKAAVQLLFLLLDQISESPETQTKGVTLLIDLQNCSQDNYDSNYLNTIFTVLLNSYPLHLHMIYIVETPLWFLKTHKETVSGSFRTLQRNQKVKTITLAELSQYISSASLPVSLGGSLSPIKSASMMTNEGFLRHRSPSGSSHGTPPVAPPPRSDRPVAKQRSIPKIDNSTITSDDSQELLAGQPVSGTVNKMKDMFQASCTTSPSHSKPLHNPREKPLSNGHSQKTPRPIPPPRVGSARVKTPGDNLGHSVSPHADVRVKIIPDLVSLKENSVSQKPKPVQSTKSFGSHEEVSDLKRPSEVVPKSSFSNEEFKVNEKLEPENHAGKSRPFSSIFGKKLRSKQEGIFKNTSSSAKGGGDSGEDDKSNNKPSKMASLSEHAPIKKMRQLVPGKMFGRREPRDTDSKLVKLSEPTDPIKQVEPVKLVEPVKQVGQIKPVEPVKQDEPVIPRTSSASKTKPQLQYENVSIKPVRKPLDVLNAADSSSSPSQTSKSPKTMQHAQPYKVTVIAAPSDPPTSPPPPPPNFKETPFKSKPPDNPPPPPPTHNNENEEDTKRQKRSNYENVFLSRVGDAESEDEGELLDSDMNSSYETIYENYGPDKGNRWMNVDELQKYIKERGKNDLSSEYYKIKNQPLTGSAQAFRLSCNTSKNRYKDVVCYDSTRVVLSTIDGVEGSDYIHANYINGYQKPNAMILTQGPLKRTVNDFWRMLWEKEVFVVVMTTKCVEMRKLKCAQYWPDGDGIATFGDISVKVTQHHTCPSYEFRQLAVESKGETRTLMHYQFIGWPDYGVPINGSEVLELLYTAREMQESFREHVKNPDHFPVYGPPMVIHCSAGIGRSGTFCSLDYCIDELRMKGKVNIQQCVITLRQQRAFSIQTDEQYMFCYHTVLEYALYLKAAMKL